MLMPALVIAQRPSRSALEDREKKNNAGVSLTCNRMHVQELAADNQDTGRSFSHLANINQGPYRVPAVNTPDTAPTRGDDT